MKKVLFALPALAFTLFLAFCQKSDTQEAAVAPDTDQSAGDRGTGCVINVLSSTGAVLELCGLQTNTTVCTPSCITSALQGFEILTTQAYFHVPNPIKFCVTNPGFASTSVRITTNTGDTTGWVFLPAGGCACFTLDDNCDIQ